MLKKLLSLLILVVILGLDSRADEPQINLHLNSHKNSFYDDSNIGLGLFISGVVLTTAIILEGDRSYSSGWQKYSGTNTYYQTAPPFLEQTPRQLFFLGGVTLIATGIYISIHDGSIRVRR